MIKRHLDAESKANEQFRSANDSMHQCPNCDKLMPYSNLRQHLIDEHFKYHCMNCANFFDYEDQMAGHKCLK